MTNRRQASPMRTPVIITAPMFCTLVAATVPLARAQGPTLTIPTEIEERVVGPYDVHVLQGGPELTKSIPITSKALEADGQYTLSAWIEMSDLVPATTLVAGVGDPAAENSRYLGLRQGRPMLRFGKGQELRGNKTLPTSGWHHLAATFDGIRAHLFADGVEVATGTAPLARVQPKLTIAPAATDEEFLHLGGIVAGATFKPSATSPEALKRSAATPPTLDTLRFEEAAKPWPVQTRGQAGYLAPQDPTLMPQSRAPLEKPAAKALPHLLHQRSFVRMSIAG